VVTDHCAVQAPRGVSAKGAVLAKEGSDPFPLNTGTELTPHSHLLAFKHRRTVGHLLRQLDFLLYYKLRL